MPGPLAIAAIGAAGQVAGQVIAGRGGGLDPELERLLMAELSRNDAERYLPSRTAFSQASQAQIDEILAQLPISAEAFNAQLASRGLASSGQGLSAFYRDIIAPVTRSATTVATQANLQFEDLRQRALNAASQNRLRALSLLVGGTPQQQPSVAQQAIGGGLSELGEFGRTYGTMQLLGLI